MQLIPKNWAVFQHYKDRCPPWIKLHRDLLNDRKFISLPTASKALAPLLWLLASENKDGYFDASVEELEFRLRMTSKEITIGLEALLHNGFFLDASTMQATCLRDAIPEKRREEERRGEESTEEETNKRNIQKPTEVTDQTWSDFLQHRKAKKAPVTESALSGIEKEARKAGWTLEKAMIECCARGWTGFKAEWVLKDQPKKTQHQLNNEAMARSIGLIPHEDNYQSNEGIIYDAESITPRLG
jgi:hypothetical protein